MVPCRWLPYSFQALSLRLLDSTMPVVKVLLHSTADASHHGRRWALSTMGQILPVFSLLAPTSGRPRLRHNLSGPSMRRGGRSRMSDVSPLAGGRRVRRRRTAVVRGRDRGTRSVPRRWRRDVPRSTDRISLDGGEPASVRQQRVVMDRGQQQLRSALAGRVVELASRDRNRNIRAGQAVYTFSR